MQILICKVPTIFGKRNLLGQTWGFFGIERLLFRLYTFTFSWPILYYIYNTVTTSIHFSFLIYYFICFHRIITVYSLLHNKGMQISWLLYPVTANFWFIISLLYTLIYKRNFRDVLVYRMDVLPTRIVIFSPRGPR